MRLDIDDQVPTQLNSRCLFAIKFSRSVDLQHREFIYSFARSVYTRQSLMQTMQYKHLLCRTSYATAPLMQTMQEHQLLCRTYNVKHLLCEAPAMLFTSSKLPANE